MRLFLDTANIEEIREINDWGILKGVTTNPTLLAREHGDLEKAWRTILELVEGDVSLETTEPEASAMYEQGKRLASLGENAVVKVPMTPAGIQCGKRLTVDGIRVNVTLVFSPAERAADENLPMSGSAGAKNVNRPCEGRRAPWRACSRGERSRITLGDDSSQ